MSSPPGAAKPKLDLDDPAATGTFIVANTRVLTPPLVPEIRLHLAEESVPIWQKTEEELGEMNVPPPYWAFAWAGGQALARYILDTPGLVAGKAVLDLGCGSGLTAIAAAQAGAASVLAADIDRLALAAVALNAPLNDVSIATTDADLLARPPETFGTVLVGDLFYERELAARVTTFIEEAAAGGATVLIGDPKRSYFPMDRFTRVAEYQVPVTRELEDAEIKRTSVWRIGVHIRHGPSLGRAGIVVAAQQLGVQDARRRLDLAQAPMPHLAADDFHGRSQRYRVRQAVADHDAQRLLFGGVVQLDRLAHARDQIVQNGVAGRHGGLPSE